RGRGRGGRTETVRGDVGFRVVDRAGASRAAGGAQDDPADAEGRHVRDDRPDGDLPGDVPARPELHAQADRHDLHRRPGGGQGRDLPGTRPGMEEEYRRRYKAEPRRFDVGDCRPGEVESQPWALNLVTQEGD